VRVRDHLAFGTAGAALVSRWSRADAIGLWAGSVLIDVDHYLWFSLRNRRFSPRAAVRFFNQPRAPQHAGTRALHSPVALTTVSAVALARPRWRALAAGMALHVALDAYHAERMKRARAAALQRDNLSCQGCDARGAGVGTHLARQPQVLPHYGSENLVSLCGECHERAHARIGAPR
jgi:hypothetical protein